MELDSIIPLLNFLILLLSLGVIFIPTLLYKLISLILGLIVLTFNIALIKKNKKEKKANKERTEKFSLNQQKHYLMLKGVPEPIVIELGKDPVFKKYINDGKDNEKNGKYKEAIDNYKGILKNSDLNAIKKVVVYNFIGSCYYQQGLYNQAMKNTMESENNLREIKDKKEKWEAQASVFYNLGLVNKILTHFPLAQSYFIKALKINKITRNQIREANIFQDLAVLSLFFKKPKKFFNYLKNSIQTYQKALVVYDEINFPIEYAKIKINLGNAYYTLAEVKDKAQNAKLSKEAYEKALQIFNKKEYPEAFKMLNTNILILEKEYNLLN